MYYVYGYYRDEAFWLLLLTRLSFVERATGCALRASVRVPGIRRSVIAPLALHDDRRV